MEKFILWKKLNQFIQYSADTKTVVPIGNELIAGNRRTLLEIIDELQMDDFVAQVIFCVTLQLNRTILVTFDIVIIFFCLREVMLQMAYEM